MAKAAVVLVGAMLVVSAAAAQQGPGLQIVPEKTDADDAACGITQPSPVSSATLVLKNNGVTAVPKSNPYLHISTTTVQGSGRCSVYVKVSVSEALGRYAHTGAFKPQKPISARLCNHEDLLTDPAATMGARVHKQLEENVKLCLADLRF